MSPKGIGRPFCCYDYSSLVCLSKLWRMRVGGWMRIVMWSLQTNDGRADTLWSPRIGHGQKPTCSQAPEVMASYTCSVSSVGSPPSLGVCGADLSLINPMGLNSHSFVIKDSISFGRTNQAVSFIPAHTRSSKILIKAFRHLWHF